MKKILCIGDSLALPGHLNKYEDTWFFLLKKKFQDKDFFSFFKRSLTTEVLVKMGGGVNGIDGYPNGADCLEFFKPDVVILQLGIVDCAPRLLSLLDKIIIKIIPVKLKNGYIGLLKKVKKRKRNNTLVSLNKFKSNINRYILRANKLNTKIIFIAISIPDERVIKKNRFISENAELYNNFLIQLAEKNDFIYITKPLIKESSKEIYEDGYHPNQQGHLEIYTRVQEILNLLINA
tara:strand:- start:12442 stop:13146 length:705 start_codon:yes stop_codon:yes gene_type:complete